MPLVLPKRCPNCATRCTKTTTGYWRCPACGWTDDPALSPPPPAQPVPEAGAPEPGDTA